MVLVPIGSGAPSGTAGTIAAALGAFGAGDFLLVLVGGSASGAGKTWSASDPLSIAWNPIQLAANANETGAAFWAVAGASSGGETVTATISTGVPGGRVYLAYRIPAGTLSALTPHDHDTLSGNIFGTNPSLVEPGPFVASPSLLVAIDLQRAAAGTAAFTWGAGWTPNGAIAGVGTTTSGIFVAEQTAAAPPETATGTSPTASDAHQLAVLVLELAPAPPSGPSSGPVRVRLGCTPHADVGLLAA